MKTLLAIAMIASLTDSDFPNYTVLMIPFLMLLLIVAVHAQANSPEDESSS